MTDELDSALHATGAVVAAVRAEQWAMPTNCPEWTVRELLNHLVAGNHHFTAVLTGGTPPDWSADHLGDEPVAAYDRSARQLRAALARPGVLGRMVTVPFGTVPGAVARHLRITEILVHGWDLAHATGQPVTGFPTDAAEQEITFSRAALEQIPPGHSPFAAPRPAPDDAPAIDRLAALLGRPLP